jgi:hypothetical protein
MEVLTRQPSSATWNGRLHHVGHIFSLAEQRRFTVQPRSLHDDAQFVNRKSRVTLVIRLPVYIASLTLNLILSRSNTLDQKNLLS